MDVQTTSAPPPKRPRSGPGTWKRHYCDPSVSPKHAKGRPSPRTSPERALRSQALEFPVVEEIAALLGPHARHQEPPHVVAEVLLRLLPMPDCARSTIALVVHRKGTGTCDDLTYRQAGALGGCDRRTVIHRFARTEGYGFIRVEPRDYPYGGAAPNLVSATIPSWVYEQVDAYHAILARPSPEAPAAAAPGSATGAPTPQVISLSPLESTAGTPEVPPEPVTGSVTVAGPVVLLSTAPAVSDTAASIHGVSPAPVGIEPPLPVPVLSPEDAAIDARLVEIHAFTRQRVQVAQIRDFNARAPTFVKGAGVPGLDDAQILVALGEYIKKQRPVFERKTKYRERLPDRKWVECGLHVFLWQKRRHLDGLDAGRSSRGERTRRKRGAPPSRQASAPLRLTAAVEPVRLGADLKRDTMIVRAVQEGSLAARLLLQPGDKVVRVDAQVVANLAELRAVLATLAPGLHTFEVLRSNEVVTTTITLEARGPPSA
jgi:PDZ domain